MRVRYSSPLTWFFPDTLSPTLNLEPALHTAVHAGTRLLTAKLMKGYPQLSTADKFEWDTAVSSSCCCCIRRFR